MARWTSEASNKSAGQSETRTASKAKCKQRKRAEFASTAQARKRKKDTPRRAVQLANKGPGAGAEATGETLMS